MLCLAKDEIVTQARRLESLNEASSLLEMQRAAAADAETRLIELDSQLEKYAALENRLSQVSSRFRSEQLLGLSPGCLVRGTVVHSSEITLRLGCGYYAEMSVQNALKIIQLRCDRLKASRTLFEARRSSAIENCRLLEDLGANEAYGGDIQERWTEQSEADWAIKHREAVRQQKIIERDQRLKAREQSADSDEENAKIWARLDELERQEALEDEGVDKDESKLKKIDSELKKSKSKSVSFAQPHENDSRTYRPSEPPNAETIRERTIKFKHSSSLVASSWPSQQTSHAVAEPNTADSSSDSQTTPLYTSPADIVARERQTLLSTMRSNVLPAVQDRVVEATAASASNRSALESKSSLNTEERPMSKFRQQRLLQKR